jgi:glycosyltransferase involved in cell wall biosynthesis
MEHTTTQSPPGMRVSVLVPTYNRVNYIAECLDSLLAQSMPALEVIVIDDGSEDGTAELLKGYGNRIRHIRKDNGGKPTAVNLGLSLAQGDLIWIFDDDDVALPDAIAQRVQALQASPDAGFVYSPHYYGHDGSDGHIQRGKLHPLQAHNPDSFLFELMKGCFFHLATALVRVDAYRAVGSFDTELLSSEDYDMQLRLAHTCPAAYCPEPSFIFRRHTGLRGSKTIRYQGTERARVFRKFDQRIGQKLRANLPLGDYLVPRQSHIDNPDICRQAILARLTIMASKGCLPEMMEDLQSLLALAPDNTPPNPAELQVISEAMCLGYAPAAIEQQWQDFNRLLTALPSTLGARSVIRSMAVGLVRLAKGYPGSIALRWQRLKQAALVAKHSI